MFSPNTLFLKQKEKILLRIKLFFTLQCIFGEKYSFF